MKVQVLSAARQRQIGFSLTELMIALAIIGILGAIAYPAYTDYITKARRSGAKACLSSFATHLERFYTTNMRYDVSVTGDDVELPNLACAAESDSGEYYVFSLDSVSASAYKLLAAPKGSQVKADKKCGSLGLTQDGTKDITGDGPITDCW